MPRPFLIDKAITALLSTPGETDQPLRQAVFDRVRLGTGQVPDGLAVLVEKIADRPWSISDADVTCLTEAGYSEDQIYELVLAAATGAGARRIDAGLRALQGAG